MEYSKSLITLGAAVLMMSTSSLSSLSAQQQVEFRQAPSVIVQTTRLRNLTITADRTVVAPDGMVLTMTVDGVGIAPEPGSYEGDIVLSPTEPFVLPYPNGGPYIFRAGVFIDGSYRPERSVAAIVSEGSVDPSSAKDIRIISREENFNGIIAQGTSNYVVDGAEIELVGNGSNDFKGIGAAIMATDDAMLTVNDATIRTKGAVRTAIFAGGRSTVFMNDCDVRTEDGTLPIDYTFSIAPGTMMEVPYGMGMTGNVRATNLIDEATIHFNRCKFVTQGWGALSSDGNGPTYMYVKDSSVRTLDSGYGAYANGEAHDYFDNVDFDVHDYGLIIGGPGSATFTNGTIVRSGRAGIMAHQGSGGGRVVIDHGSRFETSYTAIQVKGRGLSILVDGAGIEAKNGIILQTMANDDPIITALRGGAAGALPPPPGSPGEMPGAAAPQMSSDVVMLVRNTKLAGDFFHAMSEGRMWLTVEAARIAGAVSSTATVPSSGVMPTRETFRQVGYVDNTATPVAAEAGVYLTLGEGAVWSAVGINYLNGLDIDENARIENVARFVVDGVERELKHGSYRGVIELTAD